MPPKHLVFAVLSLAVFAYSGDNTLTYGGQTYKTVKIGKQVWFAENLNYEAEGSVCYENNPDNCAKYGRLYDWETAMKVCPKGWHLPSNAEWDQLFRFVDGDTSSKSPHKSLTAGKHLKAASGWDINGNGTDYYGFSALPGGNGLSDGSFYNVGEKGLWWSTSEHVFAFDSDLFVHYNAYRRNMHCYGNSIYFDYASKSSLYSVRCLQDWGTNAITHANAITYANKTYQTVKIGTQTWLAENLNYEAEDSVCYENNPAYCAKYGRLYDWETALKVCPKGWHLPTNEEWDRLFRFVDGDKGTESPYESKTAGKHLKAVNGGWRKYNKTYDGNGTDDYGFSALPGGARFSYGSFKNINDVGYWWSASDDKFFAAYIRIIGCFNANVHWSNEDKYRLFSVRCIKD
ncbi:MAG: fibrobacter succinogenes major paralogous domain-containing protein [Candidatus Fibromonas sp.]|nr:fibrobacter succinogenes major paralogous domain-containing protein [Candidatus Fibromonas sp.]